SPHRLTALDDALGAIRLIRPLIPKIRAHDKNLAEQLRDAATSMALNLGEAIGSDPGNRRARLNTASGSANESRAALLTACAWGYVGEAEIVAPDEKLDAVLAKTYRLLNPVR
ncbi:MAG: four helix bundle protein, partial [Deltaproteobacteria bacterium]|nr:four helix bundle protein [Deltaproteobacteria bacterium]